MVSGSSFHFTFHVWPWAWQLNVKVLVNQAMAMSLSSPAFGTSCNEWPYDRIPVTNWSGPILSQYPNCPTWTSQTSKLTDLVWIIKKRWYLDRKCRLGFIINCLWEPRSRGAAEPMIPEPAHGRAGPLCYGWPFGSCSNFCVRQTYELKGTFTKQISSKEYKKRRRGKEAKSTFI